MASDEALLKYAGEPLTKPGFAAVARQRPPRVMPPCLAELNNREQARCVNAAFANADVKNAQTFCLVTRSAGRAATCPDFKCFIHKSEEGCQRVISCRMETTVLHLMQNFLLFLNM